MRAHAADGTLRHVPEFKARRTTPSTVLPTFAQQLASRQTIAPPTRIPQRHPPKPPAPAVVEPRPTPVEPTTPREVDPPAEASTDAGLIAFEPLLPSGRPDAPLPPARARILARAEALLGVSYVWGGDHLAGMDCSAYLSRAWGVSRQTTDTLARVADPIAREQLAAGDALNLPTWRDPTGYGHVRLFDRWQDESKTMMWVYEETADTGLAVHRLIGWDGRYQPMRLRSLVT